MPFIVTTEPAEVGGQTETITVLTDWAETVRAEVWPSHGFNCLRWQVRQTSGEWGELLYCDPSWETSPVPTRSGHPILFPFPNRMKDGHFMHAGREYLLSRNETSGTHAIHGFSPRNRWRIVGSGTTAEHAWVRGEFRLSLDAPASLLHWPTDFLLQVTYRLHADRLAVDVSIHNPNLTVALPFGLGFHPYFTCPNAPGANVDDMILMSTARKIWNTLEGIPTGTISPIPTGFDFTEPHRIETTQFDTLFTDLGVPAEGGRQVVAELRHSSAPGYLSIHMPADFRELMLYTPPHRKALAIEPYTCATDAANLVDRGIDSGWRNLAPGGTFETSVEYVWHAE